MTNSEQYFNSHSINPEFAKNTFGVDWDDQKITIPVYNAQGKLLYCKYRHLNYEEQKAAGNKKSAKFTFDRDSHPTLFAVHKIRKYTHIILTEGEFDCIRLWQEGIPAVTSTGGVGKFDEAMAQLLAEKTVYICLDNDEAGKKQVVPIARILTATGIEVKIISLPDGYKDICEFFNKNKKANEDFNNLIKQALSIQEWWKINKPEDFATITAAELRKMEFPADQWLIDRIIPREGFCFIFGAEGTGKSFTALSMAQAIATGTDWLGQFKVSRPAKVLFIDKENPKQMTARRITAFDIDGDNIRWVKYPEKLQVTDPQGNFSEFMLALAEEVKNENIEFIVIDSFVDLMVGNENAANDVQKFFDAMRQLFPSLSILSLHHESKPAPGTFKNDAQRTRGSSNINAQTTTQFRIEILQKSKTEFTLKQTKARDAQKLDKFLIEMIVRHNEDETTDVTNLEYKGIVTEQEDKVIETTEIIGELFKTTNMISRKRIFEECQASGISEATAKRAIKKMLEDEFIDFIVDPNDKRNKLYILTNHVKSQEQENE